MLSCTSSINPQDIKFKIITLLQTHKGNVKRSRVVILANIDISFVGFFSPPPPLRHKQNGRPLQNMCQSSICFLCTSTLVRVVAKHDINLGHNLKEKKMHTSVLFFADSRFQIFVSPSPTLKQLVYTSEMATYVHNSDTR